MSEIRPVTEEAEAAINLYDDLAQRLLDVVRGAPYWQHIWETDFFTLSIDAEAQTATGSWPESIGGYEGEHHIEAQSVTVPLGLLFLSEQEFAKWKEEKGREYDAAERERMAKRAADAVAQERRVYDALKAKYGHK